MEYNIKIDVNCNAFSGHSSRAAIIYNIKYNYFCLGNRPIIKLIIVKIYDILLGTKMY